MQQKKKIDKERQMAFDSLPPLVRDSLTPEEQELFLYSDAWPNELFEKLAEFILNED